MNPLICVRCEARADSPQVIAEPPAVVCAACGHRQPFVRLPLWSLTGPSGCGKSTVARLLLERLNGRFVVLEQDVLWQAGLHDPVRFRSAWLAMAAMIQQNGRPVLLCGTVVPPEFEPLPERALFTEIRYLALTCDPDVLAARLRGRPAWREWSEPRIAEMLEYNDWVRAEAASMAPPMRLLDTTSATVDATADQVCAWVLEDEKYAAAHASASRSVKYDSHPGAACLVDDEVRELGKGPGVQRDPLGLAEPYPFKDPRQLFQGESLAFSTSPRRSGRGI